MLTIYIFFCLLPLPFIPCAPFLSLHYLICVTSAGPVPRGWHSAARFRAGQRFAATLRSSTLGDLHDNGKWCFISTCIDYNAYYDSSSLFCLALLYRTRFSFSLQTLNSVD